MGGLFTSRHLLSRTITVAVIGPLLCFSEVAVSQVPITADTTTSTQVTSADNLNFTIQQGTLRRDNLFHSFQSFSVPIGGSAQFNNPQVANIFARVTGGSVSNISGLIQANGTANLILINPQGIQFGPNTALNLGGSFLATTADAIVFNDNQQFSAVSPQAAPILTISTPIGLQFGNSPGAIDVQSGLGGISVPPRQTLALVGGEVTLQTSRLNALSGRIEIGSVAKPGLVSLNETSQPGGWQFGFGNITDFGDINLLGEVFETSFFKFKVGSNLSTSLDLTQAQVSGDINLWGQNIQIMDGSVLQAGNSGAQPGGNIVLNATGTVEIEDRPLPGVGSIPSGLFTTTVNAGNAGNITINAKNLQVSGEATFVTANASAIGIPTGDSLELSPATGSAGNIQLNIADAIALTDGATIGTASTFGLGSSGQIEVNAQSLDVLRGGQIETFTTNPNPAGALMINASERVTIDGSLPTSGQSSSLNSLAAGASGPGGPIMINTDRLQVTNGGVVSAQTDSIANAGNITINANQVSLLEGGQLISTTSNQGAAGQIQLNVPDQLILSGRDATFLERLQLVNELSNNPFPGLTIIPIGIGAESGIITSALPNATGSGGAIDINTGQLQVANQSLISSATAGPGDAGKIDIRAVQGVNLSDPESGIFANTSGAGQGGALSFVTPNFQVENGAVVDVRTTGNGPGGSLLVQADRMTTRQGGQLLSTTSGQGPAGDITLQVQDNITLTGTNSGLFATTTPGSTGAAGNIFIDPIQVLITNGAAVSATSRGTGEGGNIQVQARNLTLDQGDITAESEVAPAGDIQLNLDNFLLLRNGSLISTTAGGEATGGNIDINAPLLTAFPLENSDITANAQDGPGGQITITTQGIFGLEVRDELTNLSDITAFSQNNPQLNGVVDINTPDVDPSDNLSEQPEVVQPPANIAQGCKARAASSSFVNPGRGGLPQNPAASLNSEAVWHDLRALQIQPSGESISRSSPLAEVASTSRPSQVEAKGWQQLSNGKVILIAQGVKPDSLPPTASC